MITGSTYLCIVSFVGVSFTVALFFISCPSSLLFTVTSKLTVPVPTSSPTFAGTVTCIPPSRSASSRSVLPSPFTFIDSALNVVPSGISSFTVISAGAVPSFVRFIVYIIVSPAFTVLSLSGTDVFVAFTSDLFTTSSTGSVDFPSTIAVFSISL